MKSLRSVKNSQALLKSALLSLSTRGRGGEVFADFPPHPNPLPQGERGKFAQVVRCGGKGLAALSLVFAITNGSASEQQDLLELRNTVINLVDALVKQGVLNKQQAQALVSKAEADAAKQAAAQVATAPAVPAASSPTASETPPVVNGSTVVRVPYVPEFVKQEIREQLRSELLQDVLADVSQKAKQEKWGTPDALPGWLNSVKLYGDARVRHELDHFGKGNAVTLTPNNLYLDILKVNAAGGIGKAGAAAFLNTSEDKNRWRERVRLGLAAKIADRWTVDARISTGNPANPVSNNQTLGSSGQRFSIQLDRAYLQYDAPSERGLPWLTFAAGRISNPWVSTDLLWDEDLNFDGAALTLRHSIGSGALDDIQDHARYFFGTVGLFPIQQVDFSNADKWLAGGQLGVAWEFENQTKFQLGTAFYDYIHVNGRRNALGSNLTNSTKPDFLQKGNLLFNIANDPNLDGGVNDQIFALASDYRLLDVTTSVDFAALAPYHVILTADVVKNFGFDAAEIQRRTGGTTYLYPIKDRTLGWQVELTTGWPQITKWGDWQISGGYRVLQRDAVLDAFTESDFHLGGTDAKGYRLSAKYGLTKNVWLRGNWMSATEIDGPPLSIDVFQVDLNAKF